MDQAAHNIAKKKAPCASDGGTGAPVIQYGYVPGTCSIHVVQYQKDEKNLNPLSDYQLEVTVYDGAKNTIGDIAKESSEEPLLIVNSELPYNIIVATGAVDEDAVCFWYSDQWWCSNDQAHHCDFGPYNDGLRTGDCDFSCPAPTSAPPATATQPIPTTMITAVAGPLVFTRPATTTTLSNGVTSVITPTVAAPTYSPTGTFSPGNCGLHVRQHQRNEKDQNPTNDFELEVTLYDGKQKEIGGSGQVSAPSGQNITVLSSLPNPFMAQTGDADDDPVLFFHDSDRWDSSSQQCKVGKYSSGHRDMDCGFSC